MKLKKNYLNHKDPISLFKNGKLLKRKKDYFLKNSKVILKTIPKKNDKFSVIYLRTPTIGVAEFPPIYTVLVIDLCKSIYDKSYKFSNFVDNVYKYSEYKKISNNSVLYKLENIGITIKRLITEYNNPVLFSILITHQLLDS